jgi:succinyl-CoA synthetase beta subunit
MYLAIAINRASAAPLIIGSAEGGTSIEELAQSAPHKIVRKHVDFDAGLSEDEAREIVDTLGIASSLREHGTQQMLRMYSLFRSKDLTLLEINPFAETTDGRLIAADAKLSFDDNTEFRHPDIFNMRDTTQEDPREVAAREYELNYIGLDGSIGCMVNGAGLAMATMDIIKYYGGNPANFLDVGGSATEDQIVQAFNILTGDQKVDAILVNIFGGIMKCDVIASGIVKSAEKVGLRVPLVVRLEGTNVAEGKRTLSSSTLPIIPADNLDDAAQNVVKTQMK